MDDRGTGCGFELDPTLSGIPVGDITTSPSDPRVLYAVTADRSETAANRLLRRDLDGEWAELDSAFKQWLEPSNFDSEGKQRIPLRELTAPILKAHG